VALLLLHVTVTSSGRPGGSGRRSTWGAEAGGEGGRVTNNQGRRQRSQCVCVCADSFQADWNAALVLIEVWQLRARPPGSFRLSAGHEACVVYLPWVEEGHPCRVDHHHAVRQLTAHSCHHHPCGHVTPQTRPPCCGTCPWSGQQGDLESGVT
jgi:hypothetical protein